jgi:hypothetical protein
MITPNYSPLQVYLIGELNSPDADVGVQVWDATPQPDKAGKR